MEVADGLIEHNREIVNKIVIVENQSLEALNEESLSLLELLGPKMVVALLLQPHHLLSHDIVLNLLEDHSGLFVVLVHIFRFFGRGEGLVEITTVLEGHGLSQDKLSLDAQNPVA